MVFVIAEIGVNWDGDFVLVRKMIMEAKNAGCDAVKFQAYNEELVKTHPERSRLMRSTVTMENVKIINKIAKEIKIEWFCTPMYKEAVDFLIPYVQKFKIREADGRLLLQNKTSELIEKILKTGKEVFVSVPSSPIGSSFYKNSQIKWLYCVPKYPCKLSDLDFSSLTDFDGFSNHCPEIIAPLTAAFLGAKIIEVHVTSDRSKDFVDNNVSFDYADLRQLVNLIRLSEKIKTK